VLERAAELFKAYSTQGWRTAGELLSLALRLDEVWWNSTSPLLIDHPLVQYWRRVAVSQKTGARPPAEARRGLVNQRGYWFGEVAFAAVWYKWHDAAEIIYSVLRVGPLVDAVVRVEGAVYTTTSTTPMPPSWPPQSADAVLLAVEETILNDALEGVLDQHDRAPAIQSAAQAILATGNMKALQDFGARQRWMQKPRSSLNQNWKKQP
jgi:hypothetical protein